MSTSSISLSGMNAAPTSLGVTAHNIANLDTPDFRRQQVQQASEPSAGGVHPTIAGGQAGRCRWGECHRRAAGEECVPRWPDGLQDARQGDGRAAEHLRL